MHIATIDYYGRSINSRFVIAIKPAWVQEESRETFTGKGFQDLWWVLERILTIPHIDAIEAV